MDIKNSICEFIMLRKYWSITWFFLVLLLCCLLQYKPHTWNLYLLENIFGYSMFTNIIGARFTGIYLGRELTFCCYPFYLRTLRSKCIYLTSSVICTHWFKIYKQAHLVRPFSMPLAVHEIGHLLRQPSESINFNCRY